MNIAIVDDSESDRQLLQELLIRYFDISGISITIYPFQSGELFLAGLSHHSFDLVFLDIFMDEITGMDAAHKLLEAGCDCTIIFLTSSREYALEGYEVGAFRYLLKPLTYDKAGRSIKSLFTREFRAESKEASTYGRADTAVHSLFGFVLFIIGDAPNRSSFRKKGAKTVFRH